MDADLARVSHGVAVSPETEEAMTQVLAGAGVATAPTMITRPRAVTPPPAPPAYRPPGQYYDYPQPPRPRSPWPWLLGLLAILIAAGAGYLLYQKIQDQLKSTRPVAVVDVRSIRQDLARQKLEAEGFKVNVKEQPNDTVDKGAVIDQDPPAGGTAPRGSTVTILVSTGKEKVQVPAVKGFTLAQAFSMLADARLKANPVFLYSDATPNSVTGQDPKAGKEVLVGTSVRINISRGLQPLSVPNVVGQPYANAEKALKSGGFAVTRSDVEADQPLGQVVGQDPAAGLQAPRGSTITLSVSKGPALIQVPDVTGQAQADAQALLADAGYRTAVREKPVTDPSEDGLVLSQRPVGEKVAKKGTLVTITVGRLKNAGSETVPATTTTATTTAATTTVTTPPPPPPGPARAP
jgi:beta-lactam-binding protein with PASTA domain